MIKIIIERPIGPPHQFIINSFLATDTSMKLTDVFLTEEHLNYLIHLLNFVKENIRHKNIK